MSIISATTSLETPLGFLILSADETALVGIRIAKTALDQGQTPLLREAAAQLKAWFAGRLGDFDLPLAPATTPRGMALRQAICAIPYGDSASYGEVARQAGSGPRAIGQACRRNPLPIVVPCHRVIAAGQAIGHYSGGDGIITKKWLLDHEQRHQSLRTEINPWQK